MYTPTTIICIYTCIDDSNPDTDILGILVAIMATLVFIETKQTGKAIYKFILYVCICTCTYMGIHMYAHMTYTYTIKYMSYLYKYIYMNLFMYIYRYLMYV